MFTMRWLLCALFAILVALATAGNVVINGVCEDCTPPVADTVVVGGKAYKGTGKGTVYINGQDSHSNAQLPQRTGSTGGSDPYVVPDGYSGRAPDGSYIHNSDCNGCDIRG